MDNKSIFKCALCGKEGVYCLPINKVGICSSCGLQTARFERYEEIEKKIIETKNAKVLPKHFFDLTSGQEIAYKDVDKICKQKGYVYGGDEEISKECERNKQRQEQELAQEVQEKLYKSVMERL